MTTTTAEQPTSARTERAVELMHRFAERTGLLSSSSSTDIPPRRYLWTDAFAVANLVGLARQTGDDQSLELALRLIDQVHHELGRHRIDDPQERTGWISRLPDDEGELHPTMGGLRIGKSLPERSASEPMSSELEWHRDGQYFHYLTKWIHALDQVSRFMMSSASSASPASPERRSTFQRWARELAVTAHRKFTHGSDSVNTGHNRRMWWKMSIDLSRPLVQSMGQHDPLDGLVTYAQLLATEDDQEPHDEHRLESDLLIAMRDFAEMVKGGSLATHDPLGLGGLLVDAYRLAQLADRDRGGQRRASSLLFSELSTSLLDTTASGLHAYVGMGDLRAPSHRRLAFRELGLAIGLACIPLLVAHLGDRVDDDRRLAAILAELQPYEQLRSEIESFWLQADHRSESAWIAHEDINDVMLATSLEPEGYVSLLLPPAASSSSSPSSSIKMKRTRSARSYTARV